MVEMDITARYIEASRELCEPNMISVPPFSLDDSMSAIELMDRKLDTGLTLAEHIPLSEQFASGTLKHVE
jgi:hypothetical protein